MRKLATGRFDTRKQLEERIMFLSNHTSCTLNRIARNTGVSESTASNIIKQVESPTYPLSVTRESLMWARLALVEALDKDSHSMGLTKRELQMYERSLREVDDVLDDAWRKVFIHNLLRKNDDKDT